MGITVATLSVTKRAEGPSPADVATKSWLPGTSQRFARGDVLGDGRDEVIVVRPDLSGVEIRDESGSVRARLAARYFVTAVGTVPSPSAGKRNIALYLYPDERRGGTFRIVTAENREVATWQEFPAPGLFTVSSWHGRPALLYLQHDTLVARGIDGAPLARLPAPEGRTFRDVYVTPLADGRTAAIGSGNGYTPYHMVCVYDADGRLVFQEINREHAFGVRSEDSGRAFIVTARSREWRYTIS